MDGVPGATSQDVAQSLRNMGIKGCCGSSFSCPLVRGAKARFGGIPDFRVPVVGTGRLIYGTGGPHVPVLLPDACREFVEQFDTGVYPDLEDLEEQ